MIKLLIDLIFPNRCFGCDKIIADENQILCVACLSELPFNNEIHSDKNSLKEEINQFVSIEHAFSLLHFTPNSISQKLIHELKYNNKTRIGKALGTQLANEIKSKFEKIPFDGIVFVPTSNKNKRKRGYNQVERFAKSMSEILQIPIYDNLIHRIHQTESQVGKNQSQRFENLKNSFEILRNHNLTNKHILVLDDVCTTGATLSSCIQSIKKIHQAKFSVAVMALTNYSYI